MFKIVQKIRDAQKKEDGSAELVTTLFMLPLALFLILSLIDVSMYFNARSTVQNQTREGVRQAAMWGGTGASNVVRLNPGKTTTAQNIKNSMYDSTTKKCTQGGCKKAPEVVCKTITSASSNASVAKKAGDKVTCTSTYYYSTVTPGSDYFGFGAITGKSITIKETALSETGYK